MQVMMIIASRRFPSPPFEIRQLIYEIFFCVVKTQHIFHHSAGRWIVNRASSQFKMALLKSYQPILGRNRHRYPPPPRGLDGRVVAVRKGYHKETDEPGGILLWNTGMR